MNELTNRARQIINEKQVADRVRTLTPGFTIYWEGADGKIRGPAVIEGVFQADGHDWVWFTYNGQEILLNSRMILKTCDSSALEE